MIAVMFGIDAQTDRARGRAGGNAPRDDAIRDVMTLQVALQPCEILLFRLEREDFESVVDRAREENRRVSDVRADVDDMSSAKELRMRADQRRVRIFEPLVCEIGAAEHRVADRRVEQSGATSEGVRAN